MSVLEILNELLKCRSEEIQNEIELLKEERDKL